MALPEVRLHNTLTRRTEPLKPVTPGEISMYNCGPTVYMHMHIGNLRAYLVVDTLRRMFEYLGYDVKQVMNLTDVGHLVSDADEGEDKFEKSARREKKSTWDIAEFYIDSVKSDFKHMNYLTPKIWARATEHIPDMIEFIKNIEKNGFSYQTDQAVYFDVTKYPDYTRLQGGQDLEDKRVAVREELRVDPGKKHPADFALWVKCVGEHEHHEMRWDSPWGVGFPGWHIECSAMGLKYLGDHFDVHTGGEDHMPIHHPNERAQNFGALGKEVVNVWMHYVFLTIDGGKMGKSKGNSYELSDFLKKGYDPMDLRYFLLSAHYRTRQDFTWFNLDAAKSARIKIVKRIQALRKVSSGKKGSIIEVFHDRFAAAVADDLNIPEALAVLWDVLKTDTEKPEDVVATVVDFDRIFGLKLDVTGENDHKIPDELRRKIERLIKERDSARQNKQWDRADELRDELVALRVTIEDSSEGTVWSLH